MSEESETQIEKWRRKVAHEHESFLRTTNIHDFISWKKYTWLIEGYKAGYAEAKGVCQYCDGAGKVRDHVQPEFVSFVCCRKCQGTGRRLEDGNKY